MTTPAKKTASKSLRAREIDTRTPLPQAILDDLHAALEDPKQLRRSYTVLYGLPGTWKTTTAARFGNHNLLFTNESGDNGLSKFPELEAKTKVLRYDPLAGWDALALILRGVNNGQVIVNGGPVDNVILDNLSGMQERFIPRILSEKTFSDRYDPDVPGRTDYGLTYQMMRPMLLEFAACRVNLTVVCNIRFPEQEHRTKYGETTRADLTKAIWQLVNEDATSVVYMHRGDSRTGMDPVGQDGPVMARVIGTKEISAKNRFHVPVKPVITIDELVNIVTSYNNL